MYVLITDQLAETDKCMHVTLKEIQTGRFNPSTYPHCLTAAGSNRCSLPHQHKKLL